MILIGVFYVFPPVSVSSGAISCPSLFGCGRQGYGQVVLELPTLLAAKIWGAGVPSSAASPARRVRGVMSTFSGLLVSMTGALAHDGLWPDAAAEIDAGRNACGRFKVCAVLVGGVAIVLGCFVELLEINFMVGQAFAIAAASYFPLLFMKRVVRGHDDEGRGDGHADRRLVRAFGGGADQFFDAGARQGPDGKSLCRVCAAINAYWAQHPLLRILLRNSRRSGPCRFPSV